MPAKNLFQQLDQFLSNLLYPPRCVICQAQGSWFCADCLDQIEYIHPPVCQRCGTPAVRSAPCRQCQAHPLQAITGIRSAAYFVDNPIRPAIHLLKYKNHKAVASVLGQLLADACQRFRLTAGVIVPVPLHPARFRERGYNQSELLAAALGRVINLPVNTRTLTRTKKTQIQMELTALERYQNVQNAFSCRDQQLAGQNVLLIDDVCTTGSTLDACALALKQGGAARIWGLTLAKAH